MALSCLGCFKGNTKVSPKPVEQQAGEQLVNSSAPKKRAHVNFDLPTPRSSLDVPLGNKKETAKDTAALAKQLASLLHLQIDPDKLTAAEDSQGAPTPSAVPVGLRAFSSHDENLDKLHDDPIQAATISKHAGEQYQSRQLDCLQDRLSTDSEAPLCLAASLPCIPVQQPPISRLTVFSCCGCLCF